MKNLFIIGNGFDCYEHNLPTTYKDFREYIVTRFPEAEKYHKYVPSSVLMPDGEEYIDQEDAAGYIIRIIDECGDDKWSDLERYLGTSLFETLSYDLDTVDWDGPDKERRHAFYNNEDLSSNMKKTFTLIKNLFCDWVRDELGGINYNEVNKPSIMSVLSMGDGFLNFNYTETLEKAYNIQVSNVCHIHGEVGDMKENIFFGHGDDLEIEESLVTYGSQFELADLKKELKKDTETALRRHYDFFQKMDGLETVHSFGFSFSDVDMIYIEEIARLCSNPKDVVWYLNNHDSGKIEIRQKLERLGFRVQVDSRW